MEGFEFRAEAGSLGMIPESLLLALGGELSQISGVCTSLLMGHGIVVGSESKSVSDTIIMLT